MGVVVKRPVYVLVVVTDQFKAQRSASIRAALARLGAVRKRIDSRLGADPERGESDASLVERLQAGKRKNERTAAALMRELSTVASLEPGTLYRQGTLEGTVEVDVGDQVSTLGPCEIIVRDGTIVEIRDGLCAQTSETS